MSGPDSGRASWFEKRTGFRAWFARNGRGFRVPAESGGWLSLGGVLVFALALQIATGALLLLHFQPDPAHAFESVRTIMREVSFGWFVRLLHVHGANWMVLLAFLHLFRTALAGSYKAPRELVWVSGCVLFLLIMLSALTGYILPWSQMSYWATTVVTASIEYAPFGGEFLMRWLRGAESVGPETYRRAFAAHVSLLPLAMLAIVALHLSFVRRAGLAPSPRRGEHLPDAHLPDQQFVPFYPTVLLRYAQRVVAGLFLLFAGVFFWPEIVFSDESFLPADPFDTPPNVKPEWYFLFAYQLPRMMSEGLALVLQGIAVALLFALPFIDRSALRHPFDRPMWTGVIVSGGVALLALSVLGYLA